MVVKLSPPVSSTAVATIPGLLASPLLIKDDVKIVPDRDTALLETELIIHRRKGRTASQFFILPPLEKSFTDLCNFVTDSCRT